MKSFFIKSIAKPFLLKPVCKDYIWGGDRLREFGKISDAEKIAESWELSTHPDGESVIASGDFAGMTLNEFFEKHPAAQGTATMMPGKPLPIVKLIDAHDDLSIQVHPDKTELWYVVDAEPGAAILYGFREEITQETFRTAIANGTLPALMLEIPVKPGDVFLIPAGTLHAIGKGILVAEVQEYSNTTYRVYDYDRGRELHIAKALEITRLSPTQNRQPTPERDIPETECALRLLGGSKGFFAVKYEIHGELNLASDLSSFAHLLVLDGEITLSADEEEFPLQKGSSMFIPANVFFSLRGNGTALVVQGAGAVSALSHFREGRRPRL